MTEVDKTIEIIILGYKAQLGMGQGKRWEHCRLASGIGPSARVSAKIIKDTLSGSSQLITSTGQREHS